MQKTTAKPFINDLKFTRNGFFGKINQKIKSVLNCLLHQKNCF